MSEYRPARLPELEAALASGRAPVNMYVFIRASQKHVLYAKVGEEIPDDKKANLRKLGVGELFVPKGEEMVVPGAPPPVKVLEEPAFESESLTAAAGEGLKKVYRDLLLTGVGDKGKVSNAVAKMADAILDAIAPEAKDVRSSVIKNLRNVHLMNDSAAITCLAVMCAVANEFRSRTAFQNLSHAALLMDSSLADLEPWEMETYYKNRKELPAHLWEKIKNHPVRSQQIVATLPIVNDTVNQLILLHHELNNGQGYHRGIRTPSVLPLGRLLAFAVDVYEHLKGAELRGEKVKLEQVVLGFEERSVDPHQRRHSLALVKNVAVFLGLPFK